MCLNARHNILLVEDDLDACDMLTQYLEYEGFGVYQANSGFEGLDIMKSRNPDIILLDIMMPEMNGLDMLKKLRQYSDIPVLMLTAKHEDITKVLGLELGADDYLTKPYNPSELIARIKAILRRTKRAIKLDNIVRLSNLLLFRNRREIQIEEHPIELTMTEFNLLEYLINNVNQVISKEALFKKVIGREMETYDRTLDMHISNLRRKLSLANLTITTCRGIGFRLSEDFND